MTSEVDHRRRHGSPAGPATLEMVAGLRWREPRRAAEVAQEVLAEAAERGEAGTWLRAAGWLLHGRSAVGDAREIALEILADVDTRSGRDVLRRPEAGRLRVELAALAQSNGDPDIARDLLDGWEPAGPELGAEQDELELDRLAVLVRCALVDGAEDLSELRAQVEALSRRLSGPSEALAELLLGSVHRDDGEPAAAAERALRGLSRLGWTPADPASPPSSPHLGCALLSQWATALLEDGASADIPDGVKQLDVVDGGRHGVLWRLAVARAFAGRARPTADVLEDAASAAAAVDAPSLEAACRSAQAELFEGAGSFQDALTAVRAAMDAERTDRERAERLREALAGPAASLAEHLDDGPDGAAATHPEETVPDRLGSLSVGVDEFPGVADTTDRAEPLPDPAAEVGLGVVGEAGAAGPAMATLDLGLEVADDRTAPGSTNGRPAPDGAGSAAGTTSYRHVLDGGSAAEPDDLHGGRPARAGGDTVEPALPGPDTPWQLPGSRGADAASDDAEGSPLADALLAELRDAVRDVSRSTPTPGAPPIAATPDEPATVTDGHGESDVRPPVIVLELVDGDGQVLRHRDSDRVGTDLASRTERLVPAGADVRGPGEAGDRAVAGSVVEVAVPGAEGVALQLWARSLVSHLAGRVPRRDLPDGTVLRAGVHGAGGTVGAVEERALSGPSTSDEPRPSPRPRIATEADGGAASGTSDGHAGAEHDTVAPPQPATGGRRRKPSPDDPTTQVDRTGSATDHRVNGAAVDHLRPEAAGNAPGRHGAGEDPTEAAGERPGRRRRGRDTGGGTPGGDGHGSAATINGRARSHRDDSVVDAGADAPSTNRGVDAGADAPSANDGVADIGSPAGAATDDRPGLNGRRRSRAEARRAATDLPDTAGSGEHSAQVDDDTDSLEDAAPPGGDAPSTMSADHRSGAAGADDPGHADTVRPGQSDEATDTTRAEAARADAGHAREEADAARADVAPTGEERSAAGRPDRPDDVARIDAAGAGAARADAPRIDGSPTGAAGAERAGGQTDAARPEAARGDAEAAGATTDGAPGVATSGPGDGGSGARDRAADRWTARRPDPLDTSVPVEDVVPDGAVRVKGEWVVPGPLEQAAVDSVWNGVRAFSGSDEGARLNGDHGTSAAARGGQGSSVGAGEGPADADLSGRSDPDGPDRVHRTSPESAPAAEVADAAEPGSAGAESSADVAGDGRARSRHRSGADGASRAASVRDAGTESASPAGRHSATGRTGGDDPSADTGRGADDDTAVDVAPGPASGPAQASSVEPTSNSESASGSAADPDTDPVAGDEPTPAAATPSRRDRRTRGERRSGRGGRGRDVPATGGDPTAIPDDLGLGDLLAGALAAYRDI